MESILEKDHNRPAHDALNTDATKTDESASEKMNEVANKAAGRGLERQRQDESDKNIFTK
jgi:hypothetical protein